MKNILILKKIFFLKIKYIFLKFSNKLFFKKKKIIFKILNLFEIYSLNKIYKKKKSLTECLTFNLDYKSLIFLNLLVIKKKNKKMENDFFLLIIYNFLHCLLHVQNFKDNNYTNWKIMQKTQNKILIKYGILINAECRNRTRHLLITNQLLYL